MAVTQIGGVTVGTQGNDHFAVQDKLAVGLEGNDRIYSTAATGGHVLEGNTGADNIFFAGSASGSLYGGEGNDLVSGADGQDAMYGGEGDDWLDGNWQSETTTEADTLYGGAGRDALYGKGGDDVIYGGAGDDSGQIATASPDTYQDNLVDFTTDAGLYGGNGDDTLDGGAGNDVVDAGSGNDEAQGGTGADEVKGFAGDDSLEGGSGGDRLYGGLGNDLMSGGGGADAFVFEGDLGSTNVDHIRDFTRSEGDTILLSDGIFAEIGPSLDKKEFVTGKKAKDGNDHVVFNQKQGTIAYDDDGKGGAKAVVFATVEKGVILTHSDFDIAA